MFNAIKICPSALQYRADSKDIKKSNPVIDTGGFVACVMVQNFNSPKIENRPTGA